MYPPRLGEARIVKLLQERRNAWRNGCIKNHLRAAGYNLVNSFAIVTVIEGKVLLSDYCATVCGDNFTNLFVHDVRPDIVSRWQVEFLRPGLFHQPGNEGFNLLSRYRARTEDERVTFLPLVLLRVDVERFAILYSRTFDSLPCGAINAAEDHIDMILLDELGGLGCR